MRNRYDDMQKRDNDCYEERQERRERERGKETGKEGKIGPDKTGTDREGERQMERWAERKKHTNKGTDRHRRRDTPR